MSPHEWRRVRGSRPPRSASRDRHAEGSPVELRRPVRQSFVHTTPDMATSEAVIVDAGGRDLRVSSPDRVIFPATKRSSAFTKLDVVKYYLSVGDGIMRALERRPTTLERWPKGVHPGIVVSTREKGGGDAFFQKRIPRGAPDYVQTARIQFPSGRHADEIVPRRLPSSVGRLKWARSRFTRGPFAATTSTIQTSCASTWIHSRAGTSPTPSASPLRPAYCWTSWLYRFPQDLGRPRCSHICPDRAPLDVHGRTPRRDRLRT